MPRVEDYTDPHLRTYTRVPLPGEGVCDVCHGYPNPGYTRCWSCTRSIGSVSRPLELIVPISLYRVGEQLWEVLRLYKDSPRPEVRGPYLMRVAATIHRFMRDHSGCIRAAAHDDWDVVTTVPSKSREGTGTTGHGTQRRRASSTFGAKTRIPSGRWSR